MNFNLPSLSTINEHINKLTLLEKMLKHDEKFLSRFKLVIDAESTDYFIEDSLTNKIYSGRTYEDIMKNINYDLRKEKIQKLLDE